MLIAATRYPDCDAALAFPGRVPGLREHAVYRDGAGRIVHAERVLRTGLFMFGREDQPGPFARSMIAPSEAGGRTSRSLCAVMADVDACHGRAVAAGAENLVPRAAQDHGGASLSLRDPGGHSWTVGDDDPMAA